MSPTSQLRRAPEQPRSGDLSRKLLTSTLVAFPLLFAKVSPVGAAGMQESQDPGEGNTGGQPPGEPSAQPEAQTTVAPTPGDISLQSAFGGAPVTNSDITALQGVVGQIVGDRTPQSMVSVYNNARNAINTFGPGRLSRTGVDNVGAEFTISVDTKRSLPPTIGPDTNPTPGTVSEGAKVRVVSEIGFNQADGRNQMAVGLLGIRSRSLSVGELGIPDPVTQGRRASRGLDLAGPATAAEEHAGIIFSYVTPRDQPLPDAFPDINNPETMAIGATWRAMPIDANWDTISTSMPGLYQDNVGVRFGDMFQITRVSENGYEIATGPVDIGVSEPGIQGSLYGARAAVALSDVKGTANLRAKTYDRSAPEDAASMDSLLAEGIPQTGWAPGQIDAEFGQFAIMGYLTPFAPSVESPLISSRPGAEPDSLQPSPYSLSIGADLTVKGQIPYSGYVVAEIQPPASADQPPTVAFSRYTPGVEITGKGVLFTDAQGNQYVRDTTVQMRIPDLAHLPHKGIIDVSQDQLRMLSELVSADPKVERPDNALRRIFPGVLPENRPYEAFLFALGINDLYDLGVTSDRFMVPGNVDYRTQPPAIEALAPPGVSVDFGTRVETGEVPGQFPGAVGPRSEAPVTGLPAIVDVAPESMAAAGIGPDADFSEAFGPDTAVVPGPLEQAIEQAAAEAAASVDFQPVPTVEPGFGFDGLGLRADGAGDQPLGVDARDESEVAPGAREAEISAAAAELGSVVDFDPSDASFDLGLDGDGLASFWSASDAAAGIGADADFSGAFGDSAAPSAPSQGSVPSEGDVSAGAAGLGVSVDSSVDGSSFASGLDGFSSIGESSAASQAAAGIGSDADFSGAFGDSPSSTPADGGGSSPTRGLSPGGAGTDGSGTDDGTTGTGDDSTGTDSGDSGFGADTSSSFSSTTSYGGDSSGFGGDSSGLGGDSSSGIGGFSAASEAAASIGSDADFGGAFSSSPSTDASGFGADTSSSFSSTTSYGGDSSGFGGDSSGFGADTSSSFSSTTSYGGDSSSGFSSSSFSSSPSSSGDSSSSTSSSPSSSGGFSTSGDGGF